CALNDIGPSKPLRTPPKRVYCSCTPLADSKIRSEDSPMKRIKSGLLALVLCVSITAIADVKNLTAAEAKENIGEKATVCGTVASTRSAAGSIERTYASTTDPK